MWYYDISGEPTSNLGAKIIFMIMTDFHEEKDELTKERRDTLNIL